MARNYNPSLALQETKAGKAYLAPIRKMEPYERLLHWIKERHSVHTRRFPDGMPSILPNGKFGEDFPSTAAPWTQDPILQTVFFCNPYRENDKVTAYLRDIYRALYSEEEHVFIGSILLRWYNYIPTMWALVEQGEIFKMVSGAKGIKAANQTTDLLLKIRENGGSGKEGQLFGGAYIIRPIVDGEKGARKVESLGKLMVALLSEKTLYDEMLGNANRKIDPTAHQLERAGSSTVDPQPGTMAYAFARLSSISGMGQFYVYQFIGDLAYTHVLRNAPDWFTWGYCGPGTARGLQRLNCPTGKATFRGKPLPRMMPYLPGWREQLLALQTKINKDLKCPVPKTQQQLNWLKGGGEVRDFQHIHMRDLCNCLCEYDKYERALFNERDIKRPYAGS